MQICNYSIDLKKSVANQTLFATDTFRVGKTVEKNKYAAERKFFMWMLMVS